MRRKCVKTILSPRLTRGQDSFDIPPIKISPSLLSRWRGGYFIIAVYTDYSNYKIFFTFVVLKRLLN